MYRILSTALLVGIAVTSNAQLVLPYSGTDSSATISAFQIIKSGAAGRANTLYISNASNTSDVLLVNTIGLGKAGFFSINNSTNGTQAIRGESNGSGVGVFGYMTGLGRASAFRINNATNSNYAVYAQTNGSGAAVRAEAGTGYAGDFVGELNISASGAGAELLRFTTERPWVFRQIFSGPSAGLELFSTVGQKRFQINSSDGTNVATFLADSVNSKVGIGTADPVARLESVTELGTAVSGRATAASDGMEVGVFGSSESVVGRGVYGSAKYLGSGVYGEGTGAFGWGVYALGRSGASGTKAFRIDHPFNPENEYLLHYCSEGPQPLNVYTGNVVTNARGEAWVQLPDYFGEINKELRYTLTVVDDTDSDEFVMAKVARKVRDNKFKIRTNAPHIEVTWRVEGIRNDRWVRQYGAPVEVMKSGAEKGKYQHPELYGKPKELGMSPLGRAVAPATTKPRDSVRLHEWSNASGSRR